MDFLKKNVDISNLSHLKTKAFSKYYYEINNIKDINNLKEINEFSIKNNLDYLVIGGGSNILFAFEEFNGIIIKNNLKGYNYNKKNKILEVYSSEFTSEISEILENKYNQKLWHRFIGLPGSIGGGLSGNAGCFGLEMSSNFQKAQVFDTKKGDFLEFDKKNCQFSYRSSIFKENNRYFIIKLIFDLSELKEVYHSDVDNIKFRNELQPKGNSCGSFFKNPSKEHQVGNLLEEVGLKGFTYNSAYFSEQHANFLMTNKNNGDYKDLLYLIDLAKKKIKEKFQIDICEEVKIIKNK